MKVRLSAPARADLLDHVDWLRARSPKAADTLVERLFETTDLLGDFPRLGVEREDGTLEKGVPFGRDGYILRYEVTAETVVVRRIFHSRQDRG